MSVQACEGIWRQNCGRYVAVMSCEPRSCGQRWTDGVVYYADNGTVTAYPEGCAVDLEQYIGPLPDKSQGDQTAQIERRLAAVTKQNEQAQRYVSDANEAINEKAAENERLQAEIERLRGELLQSEIRNTADAEAAEYTARLEMQLDNSRDALRDLQEDHTAMDNRAEGARSAYLGVIKTLWEMRR